jgi:hypothetical protein
VREAGEVRRRGAKQARRVLDVLPALLVVLEDGRAALAVELGALLAREVLLDVADARQNLREAVAVEDWVGFPEGTGKDFLRGVIGIAALGSFASVRARWGFVSVFFARVSASLSLPPLLGAA